MNKFVVIASVLVGVANAALIFDATRCNTVRDSSLAFHGFEEKLSFYIVDFVSQSISVIPCVFISVFY